MSIQLHAAHEAARHIRFFSPHYELLVHLGREEEALLQARLSQDINGLDVVYKALKGKGIVRPNLLDEMVLKVRTDKDQVHAARGLSHRLLEAGRYAEALEMIELVRVDRSNHSEILTTSAKVLNKLGRQDEARAKCEEAEQAIRGYLESEETIRLLTDLGITLIQIGENEWGDRLLTEVRELTQMTDETEILENHLIADMRFVASEFQEVGRSSDANQMLTRAEQIISSLKKGPKQIDMASDLLYWHLDFDRREEAIALITEVEQAARAITKEEWEQEYVHSLSFVSHILARLGFIDRALEFAAHLRTNYADEYGFVEVIEVLINAGALEQAQTLLLEVAEPDNRDLVLSQLALELAKVGRHSDAESVMDKVPPRKERAGLFDDHAKALVEVGLAFAVIGQTDVMRAIFSKTLETIVQASPYSSMRNELFSLYTTGLAEHGFTDLAMQIVRKHYNEPVPDSWPEFKVDQVALALAKQGHIDEALEIIRHIGFWIDPPHDGLRHSKAELMLQTAVILTTQNSTRAEEVFAEGRQLMESTSFNIPWRLNCLAGYALQMNTLDTARQLLTEVSQFQAKASSDTLISAACHWATVGNKEQAAGLFAVARHKTLQIENALDRTDALLRLIETLFQAKQPEEARSLLPDIQDYIKAIKDEFSSYRRAERRLKLARVLIAAGETEVSKPLLSNIKRAVRKGNQGYTHSEELRDVILALGRADRWDEALALESAGQEIWLDWGYGRQLLEFLRNLENAGRQEVARQVAIRAWEHIRDYPTRDNYESGSVWAGESVTIGRAIARSNLIAEAYQVFDEFGYHYGKKYMAFELANNLASKGRFAEALPLLDYVELDQYVEAFCKWAPHLEKVESGLAFAALREVIRIVGWVREDWYEIYELISAAPGN